MRRISYLFFLSIYISHKHGRRRSPHMIAPIARKRIYSLLPTIPPFITSSFLQYSVRSLSFFFCIYKKLSTHMRPNVRNLSVLRM